MGAVSRTRMISLFACLGRQLSSSQLPDELLGIDSANLLIGWGVLNLGRGAMLTASGVLGLWLALN